MKIETITCDTCGEDLIKLEGRYVVITQRGNSGSWDTFADHLDRERHYCGVRCLVQDPKLRDIYNGASFDKPGPPKHSG